MIDMAIGQLYVPERSEPKPEMEMRPSGEVIW